MKALDGRVEVEEIPLVPCREIEYQRIELVSRLAGLEPDLLTYR